MALVVVSALFFRWPDLSYLAVPLAAYLVERRIGWESGGRSRLGVLLGAIYLPCLFGFLTDCHHCREVWLRLFPITPTIAPALFGIQLLGFGRLPDLAEFFLASTLLCALVTLLASTARLGRTWLIGSAVSGFAWSCLWARVFHLLLRS